MKDTWLNVCLLLYSGREGMNIQTVCGETLWKTATWATKKKAAVKKMNRVLVNKLTQDHVQSGYFALKSKFAFWNLDLYGF
jgi:hypothetical protein